jgi:hypothetical protein
MYHMQSIKSLVYMLLFVYLENYTTYRKSALLGIKCVFHFSLQLLFKIFFTLINIVASYTSDTRKKAFRSSYTVLVIIV